VCACAGADVAISLKPKNDTYPNISDDYDAMEEQGEESSDDSE
jgi:hypothetical protein